MYIIETRLLYKVGGSLIRKKYGYGWVLKFVLAAIFTRCWYTGIS